MIELRDVRKCYGPVRAVDGVSLAARPGEIFGLIGPNGAGKSTTIKMIMNILAPDTGAILFDGRQTLRRIERWLERFDLANWRDRACGELSKGMAQKVQFIAAVAHEPEFLFLDEPFAGLDPVGTDVLRETVLELGRQGKTILFPTHNMEVAERLCSRIFLIDHGREVLSKAMDEVKARHGRNAVLAEFDGNLAPGMLEGLAAGIVRYPRYVEIELASGATAQRVLKVLAERVAVRRFEVAAPSLHTIFVRAVGRDHGHRNGGPAGEGAAEREVGSDA